MRKKMAMILLLNFIIIVLLVGCPGPAQKPTTPPAKPRTTQNDADGMTASQRRILANRLSTVATNVSGVQRAAVAVMDVGMTSQGMPGTTRTTNNRNTTNLRSTRGVMVMAGLTLDQTAMNDRATATRIKRTVANRIKAADKKISQVMVTSDPQLIKRIDTIAAGIVAGQPIQRYQQEINDLGQRLRQENAVY